MKLKILIAVTSVFLALSGCGTSQTEQGSGKNTTTGSSGANCDQLPKNTSGEVGEYPQLSTAVSEKERVIGMDTSKGCIKIKLFPEHAPKAVENFITHSENGYYNGLIFHRVINEFMIQGGDPQGTGMGGESIYEQAFEDEFSEKLFNFRGALSMANSGPNTNGSQFFIVQNSALDPGVTDQMKAAGYPEEVVKGYESGGTPWLDFRHTVFGQVIEGMDIVDAIATVETDSGDKPKEDVVINKINVIK